MDDIRIALGYSTYTLKTPNILFFIPLTSILIWRRDNYRKILPEITNRFTKIFIGNKKYQSPKDLYISLYLYTKGDDYELNRECEGSYRIKYDSVVVLISSQYDDCLVSRRRKKEQTVFILGSFIQAGFIIKQKIKDFDIQSYIKDIQEEFKEIDWSRIEVPNTETGNIKINEDYKEELKEEVRWKFFND